MRGLLRRALGRTAPQRLVEGFDALVTIDPGRLPPGVDGSAAAAAVRAAVQALPGAGWISTACHPGPPRAAAVEVEVFPAGSSVPLPDGAGLRQAVAAAARDAVARVPPVVDSEPDGWGLPAGPPAAAAGFAEAPGFDIAQMEALRQLAMLAQSQSQAPLQSQAAPEQSPAPPDAAMLARLLGFVVPVDTQGVAEAAIHRFGSFAAVLAAPEAELREVPGLGTHSIAAIKLLHAAALRLARAGVMHRPVLDNWDRLLGYLSAALAREKVEQFRILFLDGTGRLQADEAQATGTVNHTPVYPREVVRRALELKAASLILVHNHPTWTRWRTLGHA